MHRFPPSELQRTDQKNHSSRRGNLTKSPGERGGKTKSTQERSYMQTFKG